ncbi:hypothetical protein [Acinetobacter rudis]|uniref:hypothetical protein n=1 Tax=Acinetobacter rudis TaxID=632955 RepID=UPI003340062F
MNTAQVIQFPAQASELKNQEAKGMYSDRFTQGYVMSSRLYREEVRPFLSDAARDVYFELENRINGHLKETDFVSYSQLQGPNTEGARQLGRKTVSAGLKELIKYGVVTVISSGKQGVKSYRINEVSIKDQFTTETSSPSEPVPPVNQYQFPTETTTSSPSEHTIDNSLDSLEFKKRDLSVDKPESKMFDDSVKYHEDNSNLYSLRELARKYPVQFDFQAQAKKLNPELNENLVFSELKNFAQWSTGRSKTTAQNWMNFWIYRIQKLKSPSAAPQKTKRLSLSQIRTFSSKLCKHPKFASDHSNVGETQKQFESRIAEKLGNPENAVAWASYLYEVGFVGKLEDFV